MNYADFVEYKLAGLEEGCGPTMKAELEEFVLQMGLGDVVQSCSQWEADFHDWLYK